MMGDGAVARQHGSIPALVRMTFLAVLLAAMVVLAPGVGRAQSGDPEFSCVPESVAAGGSVSCRVTGVAASRSVTLELRDEATVLASASGVADTQGRASVDLVVPASTATGSYTILLSGDTVEFPITVGPARPSGVSAGVGPSAGDVARAVPAAVVLALAVSLAGGSVPGLRRRGRGSVTAV
jgi:hypothetical protein